MSVSSPIILIILAVLWIFTAGIVTINLIQWRRTNEQAQFNAEKRRAEQLGLLEETGRIIAESLDEQEILKRSIDAITTQFGYAISAISKVVEDNMLEVTVITGTEDFGYLAGYKQKMGDGIIGRTAQIQKTYITENVSKDPYYFSSSEHFGSAICTPIYKGESLFGVLYIESIESNAFDELDLKTLEILAMQISGALQRAVLYTEAQENLRILSALQDISKTISSSLEKDIIAKQVISAMQSAFGYTHISIYTLEEDYLNIVAEVGYLNKEIIIEKIHVSQGVSGRTIRTKEVQFIEDTRKDDVYLTADTAITSEICLPLLKEGVVIGTLNVESDRSRRLTQADVNLLTAIASPLAVAIDNARLHEQIKKMATTDAVTGLSNRYVFEQALAAEVERAQRLSMNVSLIIFDIDSFKEYNDTYGHPAGDAYLKAIAGIIKNNLRKYDIAARYGGDEFAIILANSNEQNALTFAKRLQEPTWQGANVDSLVNHSPIYTLSIGIATFPTDAHTHNELLIAADNATLRAKHLGKNRIQLASEMSA